MKKHDGHAFAYSSGFSAVNFFSFLNPKGAVYFCVYLFKDFVHRTTMIINLFANIHQKFYARRMDVFGLFDTSVKHYLKAL